MQFRLMAVAVPASINQLQVEVGCKIMYILTSTHYRWFQMRKGEEENDRLNDVISNLEGRLAKVKSNLILLSDPFYTQLIRTS